MKDWVEGKCEVEVVDMVLRLQAKLATSRALPVSKMIVEKLQVQIDQIISTLPEDLKLVLQSS